MKASDIKNFSKIHLCNALDNQYEVIANRDLVRMYGPFVQAILLSTKRSGWLHVIPTFYVVCSGQVKVATVL